MIDAYSKQIAVHLNRINGTVTPPKSKGVQLRNWISLYLTPVIEQAKHDLQCIVVYTDGSQDPIHAF